MNSSKKRPTEYSGMSSDDYYAIIDSNESTNDSSNNTIPLADETVLQSRRTVKAKREHGNDGSSSKPTNTSNPFSNINLLSGGNKPSFGVGTGGMTMTSSSSSTVQQTPSRFSFGTAAPATSTPAMIETSQQQENQSTNWNEISTNIQATRKRQQQQFTNKCLQASKTNADIASNRYIVTMNQYLAGRTFLAMEWCKNNPNLKTTASTLNSDKKGSGNTGSTTTVQTIVPSSTSNTTSTTNGSTTGTTNMFGSFAPAPVAPLLEKGNMFFVPPAATAPNDGQSTNTNANSTGNNDSDDDAVPTEFDANDRIRPEVDPSWKDIVTYDNIHVYHFKDPNTTNATNDMVKCCVGTLRVQSNTSTPNLTRMVVRDAAGLRTLLTIRIVPNMVFKISTYDGKNNIKVGKIHFMGTSSVERGAELFAIKTKSTVAQQLHDKLQQVVLSVTN